MALPSIPGSAGRGEDSSRDTRNSLNSATKVVKQTLGDADQAVDPVGASPRRRHDCEASPPHLESLGRDWTTATPDAPGLCIRVVAPRAALTKLVAWEMVIWKCGNGGEAAGWVLGCANARPARRAGPIVRLPQFARRGGMTSGMTKLPPPSGTAAGRMTKRPTRAPTYSLPNARGG